MNAQITDFREARAQRIEDRERPKTEKHLPTEPLAKAATEAEAVPPRAG
jgi:hypothetical protein